MTNDTAITIDPTRLASGQWCHRAQKTIGEGDIHASYSADRIGMGQPVRKPFDWKGGLYVCVAIRRMKDEGPFYEVYRLVALQAFDGDTTTYAAKTRNAEAARNDPNGFYHGMRVKHAGTERVLCGPPVTFVPGQVAQLSLF